MLSFLRKIRRSSSEENKKEFVKQKYDGDEAYINL
jgi:hypothetical protein